ncbi:MAG: zinc ribbon domain-containing protein [Nitrospirae bacterium]|nr:zinc ribbon domain-containing protein [Nitrospirota bacterium]
MPAYEYKCLKCNETFTLFLSLKEKDQETPKCPKCGNTNVQRIYSPFHAVTSKKS